METVTACTSINGDHQGPVNDGCTPGEIDIHTAARHGTAATVEQLSRDVGEDIGQLRRGAVESTPAHDAAATGNMDTLTCLLSDTGSHQCRVYLSFI